jgi:hypothetical protein
MDKHAISIIKGGARPHEEGKVRREMFEFER